MAERRETMVRMGELAASRTHGDVLVSLGLGSCIGVAIIDPHTRATGLAHIMLPATTPGTRSASAKFADEGVPALLDALTSLGGRRSRLEAVLVGGAAMFAIKRPSESGLDIGARNADAVHAALKAHAIPVRATAIGGSTGRTIRIYVAEARVTVKEAGGKEGDLWRSRVPVRSQVPA